MAGLYDIIIIGSGPAGASAAIYAGRATLRTLIIDSAETGGQIRITAEVVNYPGIPHTTGADYSKNLETQIANFGVERLSAEVQSMDFSGDIKKVITSAGTFEALGVVVATGAQPRTAGFIGEDTYRGRGVGYCATCDGEFFTGMDVFVIGGGFAAAEEAIFLTRYAKSVHIIIHTDDFTCPVSMANHVRENPKVTVSTNTDILSVEGDDLPRKANFKNNKTGETWVYEPKAPDTSFGVFIFVGYVPQSALFQGILAMDEHGYVMADEDMKTNVDGIYVAGDLRPKKLHQLVTAVADGAIAATELEKYVQKKKLELNIEINRLDENKEKTSKNESHFFSAELTAQLHPILERFQNPVTMVCITDDESEFSEQLVSFVDELSVLSELLTATVLKKGDNPTLEAKIDARRYPVIALLDHTESDVGIHYHALPTGHEFNSFVLALYNTTGPGQKIEPDTLAKIKALSVPLRVEVGMSLTCTLCPDVVQGLQQIAGNNPNIHVEIIDVFKFPEFKSKYNIMSVPAVIINDSEPVFGKKSVDELIDILATYA